MHLKKFYPFFTIFYDIVIQCLCEVYITLNLKKTIDIIWGPKLDVM
jgi:hypothetical protein